MTIRPLVAALIGLLTLAPFGIVWATQANQPPVHVTGPISVSTDHDAAVAGDTIRIWIRNAGDESIEGTPRLWVLNEQGGLQQSFGFGQFIARLSPGESVWVDWETGPKQVQCMYGTADQSGAPSAGIRYPCPMMDGTATPDGSAPDSMPCYGCQPRLGLVGTFVLVGFFGDAADAHVIHIQ